MKTSLKGLAELAGHEGVCLEWYYDSVGVPTIGVGYTKGDGLGPQQISPLKSVQEALELFKQTLVKYENAVNKALKVEISQEQFDALVSICYNIGVGGLSKSTFMKRINTKMSNASISEAILMWNKPSEIMGRRKKEALLFTKGVYSNRGKVNVFPVSTTHKPIYNKGKIIDVGELL